MAVCAAQVRLPDHLAMMDQDRETFETSDQDEAAEGEYGGNGHDAVEHEDTAATDESGAAPPTAESRLAETERQLAEAHDRLLRAQAELENTRKRTSREIERVRKYALESFALELLEVKDNLERSLGGHKKVADIDQGDRTSLLENFYEGVDLTLKSMQRVFADFGIREIEAVGCAFDPSLHQAVSTLKTGDHPSNTVIELVQKGYLLNDRLLRAAMVVVAAGPGRESGEDAAASEKSADAQDAGEDSPEDPPHKGH